MAHRSDTDPVPDRRIVLAWRKSFPRVNAIEALTQAIRACGLPLVQYLDDDGKPAKKLDV